jgi:hypothetical protein
MALARILAPLLGLLLICQSCGWNRKHPPTYGFPLDVAKVPAPDPPAPMHSLCGDMRYIIATAAGNGRGSLNGEADLSLDQLALRIREIMRYRALKLVYVKGGSGVSWADFVDMLDRIWPEAGVVSIITPEVDRLAHQQHCLATSCWPCDSLRSLRQLDTSYDRPRELPRSQRLP